MSESDTPGDDPAAIIGARVRAARHERGLALGALAARARIGKGSLSEIENGARNPTLSTLYALARALDVPLSTLLAERAGTHVTSPGIGARLLDTEHRDDGVTIETFRLHLDAGAEHHSEGHGRGVVEQLLVTTGRAGVGPVRRQIEVGEGELAEWEARGRHVYRALGGEPVEAVLVIRWARAMRPA
ncbi:helix-turn-helix domain-containing protein [Nocardioides ultimimeridianus]